MRPQKIKIVNGVKSRTIHLDVKETDFLEAFIQEYKKKHPKIRYKRIFEDLAVKYLNQEAKAYGENELVKETLKTYEKRLEDKLGTINRKLDFLMAKELFHQTELEEQKTDKE